MCGEKEKGKSWKEERSQSRKEGEVNYTLEQGYFLRNKRRNKPNKLHLHKSVYIEVCLH